MTIPEILKELEFYTGRFPMAAMKAAIEQREAITPELLRVLESVADDPTGWAKREDHMFHVFALYLLAQFREQRAYPLVVRIVSAPGKTPSDLFSDTVTDGLSRILASVYDGDSSLLQGLVENERVNEFVRSAGMDAFLVLEHTGQMPRDEVVGYLRSLFKGKLERTHSFVWDNLVCAVADLPAPELLEEVRWAYAEGLVYPGVADLPGIERDIAAPDPRRRDQHQLITDCVGQMARWAAFHPEPPRPKNPPMSSPPPSPSSSRNEAPAPFVREPKIGRNDPCPCGSGKKFKKCCGKG